jgi:hypothetical protein
VGRILTHTRARLCCCDSISSKSVVKLYLIKVCSVWYCWKHLSEVLNSDFLCSIIRLAKKLTSVDEQVSCDQVYLSKVPPFDLFCGFVLVLIFALVSIRWVMAWYWISSCVCLICLRMLIGYSGLRFLYACSADVLSTWWYTYLHRTLLRVMNGSLSLPFMMRVMVQYIVSDTRSWLDSFLFCLFCCLDFFCGVSLQPHW